MTFQIFATIGLGLGIFGTMVIAEDLLIRKYLLFPDIAITTIGWTVFLAYEFIF